MNVGKIGVTNSVVPQSVGFKGEEPAVAEKSSDKSKSGNKGLLLGLTSLAAVALAGVALHQRSSLKKLADEGKKLADEGKKLAEENNLLKGDLNDLVENDVVIQQVRGKRTEASLKAVKKELQGDVNAVKIYDADKQANYVEDIKKASTGELHDAKQKEIEGAFEEQDIAKSNQFARTKELNKIVKEVKHEQKLASNEKLVKDFETVNKSTTEEAHNAKQKEIEEAFKDYDVTKADEAERTKELNKVVKDAKHELHVDSIHKMVKDFEKMEERVADENHNKIAMELENKLRRL